MAAAVTITGVKARQIYDSRGNPTVEVDVTTQQGQFKACVPSGASTGIYEALELRDKDEKHHGKGVTKAVDNVNTIIGPKIIGMDPRQQTKIDKFMVEELDGSKNEWGWSKSKLGANAILGVSLAVARAGAAANNVPLYQHIAQLAGNKEFILPVPAFNIINGGSHAGNALAMQEFMLLPTGAATFKEAMQIGSEVYHHLKKVVKKRYGQDAVNVGDEGGFAPPIVDNNECWELIQEAVKIAGYTDKCQFGMDVAASEFWDADAKVYDLKKWAKENDGKGKLDSSKLSDVYKGFLKNYPLVSIEDSHDQDDFKGWSDLCKEVGKECQIVGDDLLVTNVKRIERAIKDGMCNALLLKVNQIGSLTESIESVKMAKQAGWGVMTSHRSGETEDNFIADLAVGLATGQIKTGAPCRSERLAKYNQLLRIEEELGDKAKYAGKEFRMPCKPY
jgi:enolase